MFNAVAQKRVYKQSERTFTESEIEPRTRVTLSGVTTHYSHIRDHTNSPSLLFLISKTCIFSLQSVIHAVFKCIFRVCETCSVQNAYLNYVRHAVFKCIFRLCETCSVQRFRVLGCTRRRLLLCGPSGG